MLKRMRCLLPVLIVSLLLWGAWAERAQAQYAPPSTEAVQGTPAKAGMKYTGTDGGKYRCSTLPQAKGGVLLGMIVPCITHAITIGTQTFSAELIDWFRPMFYAFLTLVITFFGVTVLQGGGGKEIQGKTFVLLLKIAFVIGLLEMTPTTLIPAAYGIIEEGVAISGSALGPDGASISCDIAKYGNADTPLIWKQMDCVLGKLYGFATGNGPPDPTTGKKPVNMLLASSAAGMLVGFFFGGTLGVAVFFALIGVLWTVASLVLRVTTTFINGYLVVCVLLLIAPLFMPLTLLKITEDYFNKWWKAILGGILLPIIITAYAMFALLAYDQLLFKPDSRMQTLFSGVNIQNALNQGASLCDMQIFNNPEFKGSYHAAAGTEDTPAAHAAAQSELDDLFKNPFLQNFVQPLLSGGNNACPVTAPATIDVTKIIDPTDPTKFKDEKAVMMDIFIHAIELLILAFLISEGVTMAETAVHSFTGSSLSAAALSAGKPHKVESAMASMKATAEREFQYVKDASGNILYEEDGVTPQMNKMGVSGTDFLQRTPAAASKGAGAFLGGVMRK